LTAQGAYGKARGTLDSALELAKGPHHQDSDFFMRPTPVARAGIFKDFR
jgi:hypothetical protein